MVIIPNLPPIWKSHFTFFVIVAAQGSPERGTGSAKPRLRRCIKFATARCLRRPLLFRLAGKEGGEKGRLVTVGCILRLNLGRNLSFRRRSTRESPYVCLATRRLIRHTRFAASCLRTVAVNRRCGGNPGGCNLLARQIVGAEQSPAPTGCRANKEKSMQKGAV